MNRMHTSLWSAALCRFALLAVIILSFATVSRAQTGGEGGLQGTVTDSSGAAVPDVTITIKNQATGTATTHQSTGAGVYSFVPIPPGVYSVTAKREGFQLLVQKNVTVNAVNVTGLDLKLSPGAVDQTVEVTAAPPQLDTENSTIGLTIENEQYKNLPLVLNNAQRDPTAFGALAPGAQNGARLPLVAGTGNYLGQLYLDGLPAETINQQSDNRVVSQALSVDAVDQIQVLTSTPPVEYAGAGAENITMKSGGMAYHGQITDVIRNTAFDAWSFLGKATVVPNGTGGTMPAPKPVDHQNELTATVGGHVPGTQRLFFFVGYSRYRQRVSRNPASYTIPTTLERNGDFTELNCPSGSTGCIGTGLTGTGAGNPAFLFDPTTTACSGGTCTRQPLQGMKNGVPTNNVIPANYISPITKAMQAFMPAPTNPSVLINNYTGTQPGGFDNWAVQYRLDFQVAPNHRISTVGAIGSVHYLNSFGSPLLPVPYVGGGRAALYPRLFDVQDVYSITNNLVNQLKFGFVRFSQPQLNVTRGVKGLQFRDMGVTNLPAGEAGQDFPSTKFGGAGFGGVGITSWGTSQASNTVVPNNYTLLDNLLWTRGQHTVTAGIQMQWQQINQASPATFSPPVSLPFNAYSTANFTGGALNTSTGYTYASFLLGAVGGTPTLGLQPGVVEVGGRYRPIAPYISDNWKVTDKLTIDAGLRWDYLPPFREVRDRWSFLNPNLTNPATGTPGALQFAGNYGGAGVSCGCTTPVHTYWKNWGPRVGFTYAPDSKSVFRVGAGRVYSQGGGVGGRAGAANGAGQLGFNINAIGPTEITSGASAGPSFYLNNSAAFTSEGLANTSLFGSGFVYPSAPAIGTASQILDTGNYLSGGKNVSAAGITYADPYFSGRAPDFTFYNAGIEHALTNALTLSINYVGSQSHHFINYGLTAANPRGYWANQLDPRYLAGLGALTGTSGSAVVPLLQAPATPANVAKAQAAMPGISIPAFFQADAQVNASASIAQGLVAFPQYSSVSDTWGSNTINASYNSLQVVLDQRLWHGLIFNLNYTWSSDLADDGNFRSGFAIPAAAISGGTRAWKQDRIERSVSSGSSPHVIHAFGTYQLPFGKGDLGGNHFVTRQLFGGWQLSSIFTYSVGAPIAISASGGSGCSTGATGTLPLQGECMPDLNPNFSGNPRNSLGAGRNANGSRNACNLGVGSGCKPVQYVTPAAFSYARTYNNGTGSTNQISMIGNAPRTAAFGLRNPNQLTLDAAVRRTFPIRDSLNFQLEVTASNVMNHTNFGGISGSYNGANSTSFGAITGANGTPRAFQFAGHINF